MSEPPFPRFGRDFSAGEVLFREGERGEEMYVIQSGLVRIVKRVGGEYRSLATLGRGEFIGEMAILNGRPRTATALVLEDARCLVIDAATLEQMLSDNTEIALRLVKKLAHRLDSADEMIQMLLNPDPQARVLLALRRHAESFGDETPQGVRLHGSAVDIAREGGVDAAQVQDVLGRLARMRIASEDETGAIVVSDLRRLMEFMEFLDLPRKVEG
ncbi:MAG TPA: Crp/Fnr family transcriptional regulator [Polyangiaceae bacterium]|jgi:CRP/FNR family cyclic AMP-dependent transcriptional regulator|nr:Crp/Fnr family transcriptional regulator [Polyangiaceae bacterium]